MAKESRVKKSLLNARMNLICYFVSLLVAFFTRKVFLDKLGTEFIGLTGTLQSLLGFLNLAELGVGSAIGYVLYKPIFDNDRNKINELISLLGYLYRCIGLFILSVGVIVSFFLPIIFPNTSFSWRVIYAGFYAYLASSLVGYFVNYRMSLLAADQRNYIVTGYFQLTTTMKIILQMVLAIYVQSFYLYFVIELSFGIINSIILNWKINKTYPWLESEIKLGRQLLKKYPEVGKYVRQLFVHQIGGFVQSQISPILIYAFVSLPMVALYGNYTLIIQRLKGFIVGLLGSASSGIGNLISEGDIEKALKIYKEMFAVQTLIAGFMSASVFFLINPFISMWLGSEYPLGTTIVSLIVLQFFMEQLRQVTDQFKFGFGLFSDTWSPIAEAAIYIVTAIIGGYYLGLEGVLLGPVISLLLIVFLWKPYFLFAKGFHKSIKIYVMIFFQHVTPLFASFALSHFCVNQILADSCASSGWLGLILRAGLFSSLMLLFSFAFLFTCSSAMRSFVYRFVNKNRKKD